MSNKKKHPKKGPGNPNKFTSHAIRQLLDAKVYERRGMTKDQYIYYCRQIWNAQPDFDPKWQAKMVIDYLKAHDVTHTYTVDGFLIDYFPDRFKRKAQEIIAKRTDIECKIVGNGLLKDGVIRQFRKNTEPGGILSGYFEKGNRSGKFFLAKFYLFEYAQLKKKFSIDYIRNMLQTIISDASEAIRDTGHSVPELLVSHGNNYFSLWMPSESKHLTAFLENCAQLLIEGLKRGMALTGAIAYGDGTVHQGNQIYEGPVVDEAELMIFEQKWVGVTFCGSLMANDLMVNKNATFLLPEIDEKLAVPYFFQHLEPLEYDCLPYLTLDFVSLWEKSSPTENLKELLLKLKKETTPKFKSYFQNTIDFIAFKSTVTAADRYMFLRSESHIFIPTDKSSGFARFNEIYLHSHLPCILKLTDGNYKAVTLIFIPQSIKDRNLKLSAILKTSLMFTPRQSNWDHDALLSDLENIELEECISNYELSFIDGLQVNSIDLYIYRHTVYGDPPHDLQSQ